MYLGRSRNRPTAPPRTSRQNIWQAPTGGGARSTTKNNAWTGSGSIKARTNAHTPRHSLPSRISLKFPLSCPPWTLRLVTISAKRHLSLVRGCFLAREAAAAAEVGPAAVGVGPVGVAAEAVGAKAGHQERQAHPVILFLWVGRRRPHRQQATVAENPKPLPQVGSPVPRAAVPRVAKSTVRGAFHSLSNGRWE